MNVLPVLFALLLVFLGVATSAAPVLAQENHPEMAPSALGAGHVFISLPENMENGGAGYRIVRKISDKIVKEGLLTPDDSAFPLMSGDYSLILLYAHPHHQPPTELSASEFTVRKEETTKIPLGALRIQLANDLHHLPIDAWILLESGTGREVLRIQPPGGPTHVFGPMGIPLGTYDVALAYGSGTAPAIVASHLVVATEKETVLVLDSGFAVVRPSKTRITAWELLPAGERVPLLTVRRSLGNEYPLWRPFPVPPGTYDLHFHVDGTDEILSAGEDIAIEPGRIVRFNTGR